MPLVTRARLVLSVVHDDPRHLEEFGRFELLHDVLQLRPLDQFGQLVEALSTALDLLCLILWHIQVAQDQRGGLLMRVLSK